MTINKRLDLPKVEDLTPLDYLDRVRTDYRGNPAINTNTYERAKAIIRLLPENMPVPVVKALAEGSVMLYWNKTNIAGYDHYDRLELHVEVSPSGRIIYSWNALPKKGNFKGEFGSGTGSVNPDSLVTKLFFETSVQRALHCFAPRGEQ
jgi:hypothetical protein